MVVVNCNGREQSDAYSLHSSQLWAIVVTSHAFRYTFSPWHALKGPGPSHRLRGGFFCICVFERHNCKRSYLKRAPAKLEKCFLLFTIGQSQRQPREERISQLKHVQHMVSEQGIYTDPKKKGSHTSITSPIEGKRIIVPKFWKVKHSLTQLVKKGQ